jgi:hypothetical protein
MMLNALSAGLLVALTSASMAQAPTAPPMSPPDQLQLQFLRTRFCIGSGNCPVVVQIMRDCGSDADQIAQEICILRRAGGEKRELEYQLLHEGTRDGGKCGFNWYTVVCLLK